MVLKKKTGILIAIFVILVSLTMVTAGTVALFSNTITVTSHFEAGELDANLARIGHQKMVLGSDGYMHRQITADGNEEVDATDTSFTNAFDLVYSNKQKDYIVPQCVEYATFKLVNNGNVAFDWKIKLLVNSGNTSDDDLLEQLKLTVEHMVYDETEKKYVVDTKKAAQVSYANQLSNNLEFGSGSLAPNKTDFFRVTVEFIDDDAVNNNAMNQNAYLDLVVMAVQSETVVDD